MSHDPVLRMMSFVPLTGFGGRGGVALVLAAMLAALPATAQTVHVVALPDSDADIATADGSADRPWPGLAAALASGRVGAGDTLQLLPGRHGPLSVVGARFDGPVTIRAADPGTAIVDWIAVEDSAGLIFADLAVFPDDPAAFRVEYPWRALVQTEADTAEITFERLTIGSGPSAADHRGWSQDDWLARAISGVMVSGDRITVRDNTLTGVLHGIMTDGPEALVTGNRITGFSADGLRGLGDGSVFRGNVVRDCFAVDDNHDDGFQSWTLTGVPVSDLVVEGNVFQEWTGSRDHPLACVLQGIGLFDGPYDRVVIRNNVVAVSAWHGISVLGARGGEITHNTVIHPEGAVTGRPWIGVFDRKDGQPSRDVIVANNLAMVFSDNGGVNVRFANNASITIPQRQFPGLAEGDFRPSPASRFVGAARGDAVAETDLTGAPRGTNGGRATLGALEAPYTTD